MLRFGKITGQIQRAQEDHHVFFLAENTVIRNDKELPLDKGDLEIVKEAFGIAWSVELDAKDFSPVRRKRTFFSNIPLNTNPEGDYIHEEIEQSCLRDGYHHGATVIGRGIVTVKANCFMASLCRVDDPRMAVFKKNSEHKKSFLERSMSTQEREDMMGYPNQYVHKPGKSGR